MLFSYKAKNSKGEVREGTAEAKSQLELARQLRDEDFYIIDIEQKGDEGKGIKNLKNFDINQIFEKIKGVKLEEKMMFSRNLAVMIESGISLTRSLEVLQKQTQSPTFRNAIREIGTDIKKGVDFSKSIEKYPKIFNRLYVSMVRIGETAGNLVEVLNLLSDQLEKEHDLRSKIKGALVYPIIILIAMTGIGILMMVTVIPQLEQVFDELDISLPATTRSVLLVSAFFQNFWLVVVLSIPVAILVMRKAVKTPTGHKIASMALLRIPIFKDLSKKINNAAFARNLSSLIHGGVPILEALSITRNTLGNYFYQQSLKNSEEQVRKGENLYKALRAYPELYTPLMLEMLEVGEESGKLPELLTRTAEFYEGEVSDATANMSSILEPILMIFIGGTVGFFAISVMQPIYGMLGQI